MLGQPALVAGHHRGDAQRVALLAQQRVAAVARAVGPDLPGLREVRDVLGLVARPRHVRLARLPAARRPSARRGRRSRVSSIASSAAVPIRVMIRIETTTYGESVISTPSWEISLPSGPMQNGTTYIVRPAHAARRTLRRTSRASPPARSSCWSGRRPAPVSEQMNVRSSTRATSPGSERAEKLFGRISGLSRVKVPALDQQAGQPLPLLLRAVTPDDSVRLGQLGDLADPLGQLGKARFCLGVGRVCAGHCHHSCAGFACAARHGQDRAEQRRSRFFV